MKLGELKDKTRARLQDAGIDSSECRREVELIIEHVTSLSLADQITNSESIAREEWVAATEAIVQRRRRREPLQYILGSAWFMGLQFFVCRGVFIPRPDTEKLVEVTADLVRAMQSGGKVSLAEIGVGSGCVSIALLKLIEELQITAIDVSGLALETAKKNAIFHGVDSRLKLIEGDWSSKLPLDLDGVISNPPYIPQGDKGTLAPEVRDFEPEAALFGSGADGLGFYREMAGQVRNHLKKSDDCSPDRPSFLTLEVGLGQAQDVADILALERWRHVVIHKDITGIHRTLAASRPQ